jgi:hypothetical protein
MHEGLSTMPSPTYRIQIDADGYQYRTSGAIAISASHYPMIDAARALLARGAPPDSVLAGSFEGNTISAVALSRLARPYSPPKTNHRAAEASRNVD